jgi:hypothetical protein
LGCISNQETAKALVAVAARLAVVAAVRRWTKINFLTVSIPARRALSKSLRPGAVVSVVEDVLIKRQTMTRIMMTGFVNVYMR